MDKHCYRCGSDVEVDLVNINVADAVQMSALDPRNPGRGGSVQMVPHQVQVNLCRECNVGWIMRVLMHKCGNIIPSPQAFLLYLTRREEEVAQPVQQAAPEQQGAQTSKPNLVVVK